MQKSDIVISTFYGTYNYGSNLQSVALAKVFQKMGYSVYFLKRFKVWPFLIKHPILLFAKVSSKIAEKNSTAFFSPVAYEVSEERKKRQNEFNKLFFQEKSFLDNHEWKKEIKNRTIFVCGSDIIWNPAQGYPAIMFLDFAYFASLPRFSYASSVGSLSLPLKYYNAYKRYLASMNALSVREQSVADMLEPIIKRKAQKVVDPTLLLTIEEWDSFATKAEISSNISKNGFILCYFVMNDIRYWEYVKKVKEKTGKQVIVLPMHEIDEKQPYDIITNGTPYEFVWLIKNADFICTDSFHACVISIIYHKEFYLLERKRKAENQKYYDLLNRYDLIDRIVSEEDDFDRKTKDYTRELEEKLEKDRDQSLLYIQDALNKCVINL